MRDKPTRRFIGYIPADGRPLDTTNPPKGGSGVPPKKPAHRTEPLQRESTQD